MTELLKGKRGLILGVANDMSIAWAIAKICVEHGAQIALTYPNDSIKKRLIPLGEQLEKIYNEKNSTSPKFPIFEYNASLEGDAKRLKETIQNTGAEGWGRLDFLVHAIAFSDKKELTGKYLDTTLENFLYSMRVSCFSFTEIAAQFSHLMTEGGSMLTLTYLGAEKVIPHYNVMGLCKAALESSVRYLAVDLGGQNIRVNAISAGPIKTLAASGISDFKYIIDWNRYNSPLKRNVTQEEVGKSALYLLSDLGSGTTGEILHVDCGYNVVGMKAVDAPDFTKSTKTPLPLENSVVL